MDFKTLMIAARKRLGMSQEDAAEMLGLSRSHYANMEKGRKELTEDNIESVIATLGLAGDEAEAFRHDANLARTPAYVRDLLAKAQADSDRLRRLVRGRLGLSNDAEIDAMLRGEVDLEPRQLPVAPGVQPARRPERRVPSRGRRKSG